AGGLFLVLLISMNICYTMNTSLEYDTLKPSVLSLSEDVIIGNDAVEYIDKEIGTIRDYCRSHSEISYNFEGNNYVVECEKVSESPDAIVDSVINQSSFQIIDEDVVEQQVYENYGVFVDYCESHSDFVIENPERFDELKEIQEIIDSDSIEVSCDVVEEEPEEILRDVVGDYFDRIYYKNYDCDFSITSLFFDCFTKYKSPFFLISEQAKNYWYNKFVLLLLVNIALAGAMFLFIENRSNWFLVVGIFLIIASLPFLSLKWIMLFLDNQYLEIYSVLFTQYNETFLISVLAGVLMIALGIGFKFFKLGFYISGKFDNLSKKFSKKRDSEKDSSSEDSEKTKEDKKPEKDKSESEGKKTSKKEKKPEKEDKKTNKNDTASEK
ncbi:MAG: hypothetical protein ACOC1P_06020, partial [Minisyncoccales bacterium]